MLSPRVTAGSLLTPLAAPLLLVAVGVAIAQAPEFGLKQTILNPAPSPNAQFGYAVAVAGGNVLVGAPFDDEAGTDAGAAYLFDAASGALIRTFANPTPSRDDWFGVALAASADRIAIGAMQDDAAGRDAGAIHLFDAATGALLKSVPNPGQGAGDWFGVALAAYGSHFLAGAPLRDGGARDAGEVFLIHSGTGEALRAFPNPAPEVGAGFGRALAAVGDAFFVGAPGPAEGSRGGSVWLVPVEGAPARLPRQGVRTADGFGFALAAVGRLLVVGSPLDDTGEPDSGAAYLFSAP